jgi:hypothetical protein
MDRPDSAVPAEPAWIGLKDEELLQLRFCDLSLKIEGSELESRIAQLYQELSDRGLSFRPVCYIGDEWFSPEGVPAIAVPFYLAHPRLKNLELHQMLEVEGGSPEYCQKLLRHECGHAFDHAWRFSQRPDWRLMFGDPSAEYNPDIYRPRPYSRGFVQHLDNWYAQAHPDEDFAETFAVWLSEKPEEWRARYRHWKALEKLEYVNTLVQETASHPAAVTRVRRVSDVRILRKTLARHYAARRRLYAEDFPDFHDADLRAIFGSGRPSSESACVVMRKERKMVVDSVARWTGQRKYAVDTLVRKLIDRCKSLGLPAPADRTRLSFDLAAYLAALVTNQLHTGRFKRRV